MDTQTIEELVDLKGKAAVVTGGARGIGQCIALALAQSGAAVMIADSNLEAAYRTVQDIKERGGYAEAMLADACSAEDARRLAQQTVERLGALDILVNTSATFSFSPVLPTVQGLWSKVLSSHVKGVYYYCDAAAREMLEARRGGRIVNIASLEAMKPPSEPVSREVTESSVAIISKALAIEYGPHGINVNALAPGAVRTPAIQRQAAGLSNTMRGSRDDLSANSPLPLDDDSLEGAEEIVTAVLFLVSEAGESVTGNLIVVE
ncbi:MAG: SDR family oxidoreductase [Chloroflexi bacterium]|nr:SDR family oxidoreductase [Chloroflexota bacterium]